MIILITVIISSFLGGFTQTTTGFGCGIIVMLFLPYVLSMTNATALNVMINTILNVALLYRFRNYFKIKKIIFPTMISIITSTYGIYLSRNMNLLIMKIVFSIFLIILAGYFIIFSNRLKLKDNMPTAGICASLAGLANGMFGIGGPPMAIYFLSTTQEKGEYIANIQGYFFLTSIYTTILRFLNGMITSQTVILLIPGLLAVIIGQMTGLKIINIISRKNLEKIVHYFIAIAGIVSLISCI